MNSLESTYKFYTKFGATYECGTYGSGSYNSAGECTTGTGVLPATGEPVVYGLVGGVLLLVVGVVILVVTRKKGKKK